MSKLITNTDDIYITDILGVRGDTSTLTKVKVVNCTKNTIEVEYDNGTREVFVFDGKYFRNSDCKYQRYTLCEWNDCYENLWNSALLNRLKK